MFTSGCKHVNNEKHSYVDAEMLINTKENRICKHVNILLYINIKTREIRIIYTLVPLHTYKYIRA